MIIAEKRLIYHETWYHGLMCGIAGFIGEDRGRIDRMTDALVHRGPDGNARYVGNGVSLGHARLAILDPGPEADQPMWNDKKTVVIVYNGEIYNYRALARAEQFACRTTSDTEVILKLYEKYGIECVKLLRGMFAFALFDTAKNTLFLTRDSSGIKPLFVSRLGGTLSFASEMRALMKALPEKPKLNFAALSHYVRLHYVPGPETLCEGIESLPAGTILSYTNGREQRQAFKTAIEPIAYASKTDFSQHFPDLMDMVVKDHLVSDKPVGIFLSGGMDSSIVLHHMCRHAQKPVKTFTVRFEAKEEEDAARFNRDADTAKKTALHYGTDHREITLTAALCRDVYRDTAKALDQPNADSVAMAQFVLAREAKKHVDVVLTGSGGDELFGGYPRYRIARILSLLQFIPAPLRGAAGKLLGYPEDVLRMSTGPALAERLLARSETETNGIVSGHWYRPDVTTELFRKRFEAGRFKNDPVRAFMEFDRELWLVDESLRLADAVTMASGLECRVPFLDPLVISASHGTNTSWHTGPKRTKALLKDTYYPILPDCIRSIDKASFYPPLAKWFRRECAPLVEHALAHPRIRELFDTETLKRIFTEHREHKKYGLHTLQMIVQLSYWFDTVYDHA